jgi:hypothetical protein
MSTLDRFKELGTTSQSRRRGEPPEQSDPARRGDEGLGRIATGWLMFLGGLFDAERDRRVLAAGSETWGGD